MPVSRHFFALTGRWFSRTLLDGPRWALKVALCSLLLVLILTPPNARSILDYLAKPRPEQYEPRVEADRDQWDAVAIKIAKPFQEMSVYFSADRQEAKRTYRVTVPLMAHVLGLGLPAAVALGVLAGPVIFACLIHLARQLSRGRLFAASFCLMAASIYFGQSFLCETGGMYDAWGYAFLLLAMCARMPVLIGLCVLLAAFCDERAMASSPMVLLYHLLRETPVQALNWRHFLRPRVVAVVLGWICYLGGRYFLSQRYSLPTTNLENAAFLLSGHVLEYGVLSLFTAWKLALPALPLGLWLLWRRRKSGWFLLLFLGAFTFAVAVAYMPTDQTRGLSYLTPSLIVLAWALKQTGTAPLAMLKYLWPAALISLILPNIGIYERVRHFKPVHVQIYTLVMDKLRN